MIESKELDYYGVDISFLFQTSIDGNTMVYGGYSKYIEDMLEFSPIIITDNGNEMIAKFLPEGSSSGRTPAFCLTPQNRIIPLIIDAKGCWSYDFDLNPLFLDYGETLSGIEWRNTKFFSFNHHLFGLLPGYRDGDFELQFVEVVLDGYTLNVTNLDEESFPFNEWQNITMLNMGNQDYISRSIPNGKIYPYYGGMVIADAKNHTLTVDSFPEGFPSRLSEYDKDGYSWVLTDNYSVIMRYSVTDKTVKQIDVKWVDYTPADFVLMNYSVVSGIIYLTATTRDAQQHSFIIDGETGQVSDVGVTDYAGAQIKVYVRLN